MNVPKKIKVLEAIRQGQIGGGETHVLDLVKHICKSRFEPVVLSFTDGPMIDRLNEMGIRNFVIPSRRAFDIRQWRKVVDLIRRENIDLIHVHGSRAASNLIWAAKFLKIPIVYTIHGWSFHDDQPLWIKQLRIRSEQFLTSRMSGNISVSASNQRTGKKYFSKFSSSVVNNGIDLERFNADAVYPDIREELGIGQDEILISYIARITAQKDPVTLITAFKRVLQDVEQVRLLMVGDGDLKEKAMEHAQQLGIQEKIIFQPFRQDVPALLHASDIYCLPSLWEGLPIGLLEAMAMENAVVATEVDGSKEVITHGENGLLVPPGQPCILANVLTALCMQDELRARLRQNARQTVVEKYNIATMTNKIETVYESIIFKPQPLLYV